MSAGALRDTVLEKMIQITTPFKELGLQNMSVLFNKHLKGRYGSDRLNHLFAYSLLNACKNSFQGATNKKVNHR